MTPTTPVSPAAIGAAGSTGTNSSRWLCVTCGRRRTGGTYSNCGVCRAPMRLEVQP